MAKLDRIVLQPSKDEGTVIRAAAASAGESVQGYCLTAIRARMERDSSADQSEEAHHD